MASIVLIFLIGIGIGYALSRLMLYSYMKWQEKHSFKETISHQDLLYGSWKYSVFYGALLLFVPLNKDTGLYWLIAMNLVWVGLVVLEEYSKRGRRQLKNYMEEIRKEKDLPINEMSLPEIKFWIKTLTKDKRKLERVLKRAKKNNFKKIIKSSEKALKDINNDLEALITTKVRIEKNGKKINQKKYY